MSLRDRASAVIAIGGDVPPELLADRSARFPSVLIGRADKDEWLTQDRYDADIAALTARGVPVVPLAYEGTHEWTAAVSSAIGDFIAALPR